MCVQIDEAGSDHQPRSVNHPIGAIQAGADDGDFAVQNSNVGCRVHAAGWVHYSPAADHQATYPVISARVRFRYREY